MMIKDLHRITIDQSDPITITNPRPTDHFASADDVPCRSDCDRGVSSCGMSEVELLSRSAISKAGI
jgi:hypothetical protein